MEHWWSAALTAHGSISSTVYYTATSCNCPYLQDSDFLNTGSRSMCSDVLKAVCHLHTAITHVNWSGRNFYHFLQWTLELYLLNALLMHDLLLFCFKNLLLRFLFFLLHANANVCFSSHLFTFLSSCWCGACFLLMETVCTWYVQHITKWKEFILTIFLTETTAFAHLQKLPFCVVAVFVVFYSKRQCH